MYASREPQRDRVMQSEIAKEEQKALDELKLTNRMKSVKKLKVRIHMRQSYTAVYICLKHY